MTDPAALTLHAISDRDLDAWAGRWAAWAPETARTPATLRERRRTQQPHEWGERWSVQQAGEEVGLLELESPRTENQPGWVNLRVAAPALRHWPALLALGLERARTLGASHVTVRSRENRPELPAVQAAGFAEYDRMFTSRLDLQALDLAPFAPREAAVRAAGVRVLPVSEAAQALGGWPAEAAQRRLYTLIISRLLAVPGAVTIQPWPFEVWQERTGLQMDPAGVFVAVDPAGDWVGLSELCLEPEPGVLLTGLTGVEPEWQGRGVALALKVAALRSAQARGYREVRTSNHARNAAMLGINRALGFVPDPATLLLSRELA
ncbi:N-acetyltransferase [Deinococcus lacus]|uniref:N-acetyltransferase n=1 Tax=Deinococcus lacus TaxID=392561 RepID=A0ABW1YA44_9DEIO